MEFGQLQQNPGEEAADVPIHMSYPEFTAFGYVVQAKVHQTPVNGTGYNLDSSVFFDGLTSTTYDPQKLRWTVRMPEHFVRKLGRLMDDYPNSGAEHTLQTVDPTRMPSIVQTAERMGQELLAYAAGFANKSSA